MSKADGGESYEFSELNHSGTGFVKEESHCMHTTETPFEFFTVSYLTRIGNQSAGTLAEFLKGLQQ